MVATIAEVELPAEEFTLYRSLSMLEELRCEVERFVASGSDRVMPYVWVSGDGYTEGDVSTTLADDSSIEQVELLANLSDEWLYQMDWIDDIETLVQILVEEEGTILAATGNQRVWHLRILFPEREALSRTYEYCEENDLVFRISNIYQVEEGRKGRFGLLNDHQDTLELAYKRGYYEVPRGSTAGDLGKELGISHQAVSERLRRAHGRLVENAIVLGKGANYSDDY
ncbi:helix-turn-helix domain-containing protein [Haladaptatus caseinilyticus]|uniref:helix-turn-helix domain-containing protein n=1 Tax=Haladaptatus caseinilyticus TaxID=2993314 RepID=UPI00224B156D|nr:helix-turn-helix domain-containing protein [Haladaptatus caseinilyticus]